MRRDLCILGGGEGAGVRCVVCPNGDHDVTVPVTVGQDPSVLSINHSTSLHIHFALHSVDIITIIYSYKYTQCRAVEIFGGGIYIFGELAVLF